MLHRQRIELIQIVQMSQLAAAPVDSDIAIRLLRQRGQQNRTRIGEAGAAGNQHNRPRAVFTQPGVAVRHIHGDLPIVFDAIHHRHGVQVQL